MNSPLGTLHIVDGKPVLRFERFLNHAPEKVWSAVTDPAEMAAWFPATIETELKAGAPMRFSFGDQIDLGDKFGRGEIIEIDRPKVYAFRWFDSVLRIEIVPEGTGCRLYFSQAFSGAGTWGDLPAVARQAPGWDACLGMLTARLDGQPAPIADNAWFLDRAERYVEEFGLGVGTVHTGPDGYLIRFERDLVQPPDAVQTVLDTAPFADSAATVELGPQEPVGTRLVLTQHVSAQHAGSIPAILAARQAELELLFAALFGDIRPADPARVEQLTKHYQTR